MCAWSVCIGTSSGMAHSVNIEAAYQQYVNTYTNCTYIDGNVELVFLTNRTNYDLFFLKVRAPTFFISRLSRPGYASSD